MNAADMLIHNVEAQTEQATQVTSNAEQFFIGDMPIQELEAQTEQSSEENPSERAIDMPIQDLEAKIEQATHNSDSESHADMPIQNLEAKIEQAPQTDKSSDDADMPIQNLEAKSEQTEQEHEKSPEEARSELEGEIAIQQVRLAHLTAMADPDCIETTAAIIEAEADLQAALRKRKAMIKAAMHA